ncbi:hypothetical protein COCOBI_05-2000 [Coccomyxa sp. Obi]|nr:hypothetical protein COCOBI_05-2000 [Coccomyxa sp. Obi]
MPHFFPSELNVSICSACFLAYNPQGLLLEMSILCMGNLNACVGSIYIRQAYSGRQADLSMPELHTHRCSQKLTH